MLRPDSDILTANKNVRECRQGLGAFAAAAAQESNAGTDLQLGDVLVNYATGHIVLPSSQPLRVVSVNVDPQTKNVISTVYTRIYVTYSSVTSASGRLNSDGGAVASAPPLSAFRPGRSFVRNGKSVYPIYTPRQTQCTYASTNLQSEMQYGVNTAQFLAVTLSDSRLEFLADPNTKLPLQVRDQRYCNATSQPYAASSYGISQVLPESWNDFSPIYNKYLDISNAQTPIFNLLNVKQFGQTGIYLAASRLQQEEAKNPANPTNEADFENHWSHVFYSYNGNGFGYTFHGPVIGIISQGASCFYPGAPPDGSCGTPQP